MEQTRHCTVQRETTLRGRFGFTLLQAKKGCHKSLIQGSFFFLNNQKGFLFLLQQDDHRHCSSDSQGALATRTETHETGGSESSSIPATVPREVSTGTKRFPRMREPKSCTLRRSIIEVKERKRV